MSSCFSIYQNSAECPKPPSFQSNLKNIYLGSKHGTHSRLATQDDVMYKGDMANGCDIDDQQIDHSTESYTKRIVVTVQH